MTPCSGAAGLVLTCSPRYSLGVLEGGLPQDRKPRTTDLCLWLWGTAPVEYHQRLR